MCLWWHQPRRFIRLFLLIRLLFLLQFFFIVFHSIPIVWYRRVDSIQRIFMPSYLLSDCHNQTYIHRQPNERGSQKQQQQQNYIESESHHISHCTQERIKTRLWLIFNKCVEMMRAAHIQPAHRRHFILVCHACILEQWSEQNGNEGFIRNKSIANGKEATSNVLIHRIRQRTCCCGACDEYCGDDSR